ncbi:hypothetical protein VC81_09750 [Levilactobacillus spicheri]|uniref:Uncharacterized protein n=1 Tax=Levilactobacillus spicheri TaxID=216463 RepID=A0A0F3RQI1_9LACO|nr:hypothetical protein VC81_09750 [Levilactobacillus spicheri]
MQPKRKKIIILILIPEAVPKLATSYGIIVSGFIVTRCFNGPFTGWNGQRPLLNVLLAIRVKIIYYGDLIYSETLRQLLCQEIVANWDSCLINRR